MTRLTLSTSSIQTEKIKQKNEQNQTFFCSAAHYWMHVFSLCFFLKSYFHGPILYFWFLTCYNLIKHLIVFPIFLICYIPSLLLCVSAHVMNIQNLKTKNIWCLCVQSRRFHTYPMLLWIKIHLLYSNQTGIIFYLIKQYGCFYTMLIKLC